MYFYPIRVIGHLQSLFSLICKTLASWEFIYIAVSEWKKRERWKWDEKNDQLFLLSEWEEEGEEEEEKTE